MAAPALLVWLAPAALLFSLVALVVAARAGKKRGRQRDVDVIEAVRQGDLAKAIEGLASGLSALQSASADAQSKLERLAQDGRLAVRHAAVVRFDALEEHTGELSFSMALMDDERNGVIITSINGRQQTRVYAKSVERGTPSVVLSEEELQAIAKAMGRA